MIFVSANKHHKRSFPKFAVRSDELHRETEERGYVMTDADIGVKHKKPKHDLPASGSGSGFVKREETEEREVEKGVSEQLERRRASHRLQQKREQQGARRDSNERRQVPGNQKRMMQPRGFHGQNRNH